MPVDAASAKIVQNVINGANKPTEVILMHDIHPQSVKAVPVLLRAERKRI